MPDTGLHFDDSVPVETRVLSSPALSDVPEDERVLITEKITYRLAQRPGSYVVLKYVRPVIKRKDTRHI
jgi:transposase